MQSIRLLVTHSRLYRTLSGTPLGKRLLNKVKKSRYIKELLTEGYIRYEQERPAKGDYKDFSKAVKKHLVSFDEYFYQFEFWNKNEEERYEFCSQVFLRLLYNTYLKRDIEDIFWRKSLFLKTFSDYISREWIEAQKCTYEEFERFVTRHDCIIKPQESSCGHGIFKHLSSDNKDLKKLYDECLANDSLLEECISNEPTLEQFHPESLNTIRIVTINTKQGVEVLGAFVRFGTGQNVVDNGGTDGILASIDVESGRVVTDAFDKNDKRYEIHPDSNMKFFNLLIPRWKELVSVCKEAALVIPSAKIIGWDIVVTDSNVIEIIEGNHRPDAYGLQMPVKKGYKSRLKKLMNE